MYFDKPTLFQRLCIGLVCMLLPFTAGLASPAQEAVLSQLHGPMQDSRDRAVAGASSLDLAERGEIDPERPMVALTFDDGPSSYTEEILRLLREHGGRATFCVIGTRLEEYPEAVQKAAAQGCEIATHTWSHKDLTSLNEAGVRRQLTRSMEAITEITGQPVRVLRPPYGGVNRTVRSVAKALNLTIVTWSIDTRDWSTQNADTTARTILRKVQNGSIILCHDSQGSTARAMKQVIPALLEQGYQLVTVSELLSFSKTGGEAGKVYNHLDTQSLSK